MNSVEVREKLPIGSIAYYVENKGNRFSVEFGIVDDFFSDSVSLNKIDFAEDRFIDGVYYSDLYTPTKWRKLPKGWTYNTKMFNLENNLQKVTFKGKTYDEALKLFKEMTGSDNFHIDKPNELLAAYKVGFLISCNEKDYSHIRVDIDRNNGYRLTREYGRDYHPYRVSLNYNKVYVSYEDAAKEISNIEADLKRISELSDRDWSIEQIDKVLDIWQSLYRRPDDEKLAYRDWLLAKDNIEDIIIKVSIHGGIEWKYDRNKTWREIVL